MVAITGVAAYVDYKMEDSGSFGTAVTTTGALGFEERVTSFSYSSSQQKITTLSEVAASSFYYGQVEGSIGIDFIIGNPWWVQLLFGKASKTATAARASGATANKLYGYKWEIDTSVKSATLDVGMKFPSGSKRIRLLGCILENATLTASAGEPVRMSTSWKFGKTSTIDSTVKATTLKDDLKFPYTFAHLTIDTGGTAIKGITNFSLNMNPNASLLYNIGESEALSAYKGVQEFSGSLTRPMDNRSGDGYVAPDALLKKVISRESQGTATTLSLKLNNGRTGSTAGQFENNLEFKGTGLAFSNYSTSLAPDQVIEENLDFDILSMEVLAENEKSVSPVKNDDTVGVLS